MSCCIMDDCLVMDVDIVVLYLHVVHNEQISVGLGHE